jgi:hypothetical protein
VETSHVSQPGCSGLLKHKARTLKMPVELAIKLMVNQRWLHGAYALPHACLMPFEKTTLATGSRICNRICFDQVVQRARLPLTELLHLFLRRGDAQRLDGSIQDVFRRLRLLSDEVGPELFTR